MRDATDGEIIKEAAEICELICLGVLPCPQSVEMLPLDGFDAVVPAFVNEPALHEVKGDADKFPGSEELL